MASPLIQLSQGNTPSRALLAQISHVETAITKAEDDFLHAVEFGDVPLVKSILEENPYINVDCTDALGRTPLRLAVKNENKELVEMLVSLSNADNTNEAVLQAIDAGFTSIAEITLRHPKYLENTNRMRRMGDVEGFFKRSWRGSQFPSYVTPLMLASQKNQYVIVQLLLQRGEYIIKPHKFGCPCQECTNKRKYDQLRLAKSRLDAFKGLCSEAYISLNSQDPFLTAFELAHELRRLAKSEVFFKREYTDLADHLSTYVVKLLDRVWTHRELSVVLDKCGPPTDDVYESLARFKMAVDLEEKAFVTHPNCQQRIDRCWFEGMGKIKRLSWPQQIGILILSIVAYPVFVAYFLIAPESKTSKILKVPAVKFICHTLSFFAFLILIIISCFESISIISDSNTLQQKYPDIHEKYKRYRQKYNQQLYYDDFPLRTLTPQVTEILILIWVIAMVVQECQELWSQGIRSHFSDKFNLLDFVLLSVYIATYSLRFLCIKKLNSSVYELQNVPEFNLSFGVEAHIYWINADRSFWDSYDPINTAEGLFAIANIFSFSRIAYLLRANETLGPLQISLGRMINDIMQFFALAVIVIIAFLVALRNLYWYYSNRDDIEINGLGIPKPEAVEKYGDELAAFRTVFWAIYGRGQDTDVSLGNYNNTVTEKIGESISGLYHIIMIILLLNILVAMMTRTFDKTAEDADIEWKFARSTLYMEYITKGRVLPVPFNILEVLYKMIMHFIQLANEKKEEVNHEHTVLYDAGRRTAISNVESQRRFKVKDHV
ncbi:short transient receptor potential channel 6-like [Physella acuta]|uniref:short transient receptor potential channel 6-like n=1 Tax=Physella acuta TaxID=109671 RepID=UPI0027DB7AE3|nr:short transient receptor potential channel 6-like [Physella acuta]